MKLLERISYYIPFLGFRPLTMDEVFMLELNLNVKWEALVFEWMNFGVYIMCRRY